MMPDRFELAVPTVDGTLEHALEAGDILFVLGPNGSGKSTLITKLFNSHAESAKRISAHRQTWFESNTLDLTPRGRERLESNIRSQDQQEYARWRQDYPAERAGAAIYDLIDADTMLARSIAALVRDGELDAAQDKARSASPIQTVNELLRLSNLPIEISVERQQKIVVSRNGSAAYSVAELSDGERNAFLIASDVLTAEPGTLLLIDEPERHLHRSIISPLLSLLFEKRHDCAFVVSTHDVMLPVDNPGARTLLVRSCKYESSHPQSWTADLVPLNAPIDDELKRDILGARENIIFVEGTNGDSLDVPLYSLLFPQVSVIPKGSCRDVVHAVRGLRGSKEMHWLHVWGIVDNDRRSTAEVARLRSLGVHPLSHFSVESIYYHPEMIRRVAIRQAGVTGEDQDALYNQATTNAVEEFKKQKEHLVLNVVERLVRERVSAQLPGTPDVQTKDSVKVEVNVAAARTDEATTFDALIANQNLEGLLRLYSPKRSGALTQIARGVGLTKPKYVSAVRKLLQEDDDARVYCRGFFGELTDEIDSVRSGPRNRGEQGTDG